MPGVTVKNYRQLMNTVHNLAELSTLTEERLGEIMGNSAQAKTLYDFIHLEHKKGESSEKVPPSRKDFKRGFKRKK